MSFNLRNRSLLSVQDYTQREFRYLLDLARDLKRAKYARTEQKHLIDKEICLIFEKTSTRTRCSFEVACHDQGANVTYLDPAGSQIGHKESFKDTARVLGRMVHGAIFRTFAQSDVEEFAQYGNIPTINALTDDEHPCQILADIVTVQEKRGPIRGKVVCFIGDGDSNMARSWIFAAGKADFELRVAAPKAFQPPADLLRRAGGRVVVTDDVKAAASGADVLYTDVWISMGKEAESASRVQQMTGYQINAGVVKLAKPGALVMHCLPAYRGKEIDEETFEANAQTILLILLPRQ